MVSDPALAHVRLVVTARPDTPVPEGAQQLVLGRIDDRYVDRYLGHRGVSEQAIPALRAQAAGNWLIARLLADLILGGTLPTDRLPDTLEAAYQQDLRRAGLDDSLVWQKQLRPVLAVLAVSGVGPVLPLQLLGAASGRLGGPAKAGRVHDVLVRLRGLVVRGNPGTPREQVGLFHVTLADYLFSDPKLGIDLTATHGALADAISELAPMDSHDPTESLHRYAANAEAEHLWYAGRREQAMASLYTRESHIPSENLARLIAWYPRILEAFGPDHPESLTARHNIAFYTSRTGDPAEALRLYRGLLADSERVLGPHHQGSLSVRHEVAYYTGETGDPAEALRLFQELLADQVRILGPEHPDTLTTQEQVNSLEGQPGEADA